MVVSTDVADDTTDVTLTGNELVILDVVVSTDDGVVLAVLADVDVESGVVVVLLALLVVRTDVLALGTVALDEDDVDNATEVLVDIVTDEVDVVTGGGVVAAVDVWLAGGGGTVIGTK